MVDGCDKLPTKGGIIQSYKTHETGFGSGSFSSTYCVELCEEHWNQQVQFSSIPYSMGCKDNAVTKLVG